MNEFQENISGDVERTLAERHIESVGGQGRMFVEAARVNGVPMLPCSAIPLSLQAKLPLSCRATPWMNSLDKVPDS
jgi:hypothetical protein